MRRGPSCAYVCEEGDAGGTGCGEGCAAGGGGPAGREGDQHEVDLHRGRGDGRLACRAPERLGRSWKETRQDRTAMPQAMDAPPGSGYWGAWSAQEQEAFQNLCREHGKRWVKIASLMPGRTSAPTCSARTASTRSSVLSSVLSRAPVARECRRCRKRRQRRRRSPSSSRRSASAQEEEELLPWCQQRQRCRRRPRC